MEPLAAARDSVQRYLEKYELHLEFSEFIDQIVFVAVESAIVNSPKLQVSREAMMAFERLAEVLGDSHELQRDINKVRTELISRGSNVDSLYQRLSPELVKLLHEYGWQAPKGKPGRPRNRPMKLDYCPHHGDKAEFRQYPNGESVTGGQYMVWRCIACMAKNRKKSRLKAAQLARQYPQHRSTLTPADGTDKL